VIKEFTTKLPEMLDLLKQIIELESPSHDAELINRLVSFIAERAAKSGGRTDEIKQEDQGNHLRVEWGEGEEQLLLLCHIDTVYKRGEIKKRPFTVQGDKVSGPGVYDMKGGVVQAIFAMEYLVEHTWPLNCRVVALFTSDEEIGSPSSRELIEGEAKRSKVVLVLEPAAPPAGAIKTSRKGVGEFKIKVEGVAAHAGNPQEGASAVLELAHQIIHLHSLSDYDKGTTVNVGRVEGGTASNVVADYAEANVDLRMATRQEGEWVAERIAALSPRLTNTRITVTGGIERYPLERTEQVAQLFELARAIAQELGFKLEEGSSGGASDGNLTASLGVPTLDGLGPVGDGAHAAHEHIVASKLAERTALLVGLLQALGRS